MRTLEIIKEYLWGVYFGLE